MPWVRFPSGDFQNSEVVKMIKDNVLYFGYGDVSVGSRPVICQESFRGFRPPSEIGRRVTIERIKTCVGYDRWLEEELNVQ